MGIDDIKPLGGPSPFPDPSAEAPLESERTRSFAEAKGTPPASDAAESTRPTFAGLDQFSRSALADPSKVEGMVRSSVSALVDAGQSVTGELTPTEKEMLTNFFSSDPLLRQQIETYLRKVLV